jgi:hypothetical protein
MDVCDGEKWCDDGTDEVADLFPNVTRCNPTTGEFGRLSRFSTRMIIILPAGEDTEWMRKTVSLSK